MKTLKASTLLVLIALFFMSFSFENINIEHNEKAIFKIGRSIDKNEIHYFIKLNSKGELHPDEPLEIGWINYENGGKREKINWIKKRFGYGLNYTYIKPYEAAFKFVSYDERSFTIMKNDEGNFSVFTKSKGKIVEVQKIFINIDGGSFWIPNVTYVELSALEPQSKSLITEIIKP
jgi:hypothetical protein